MTLGRWLGLLAFLAAAYVLWEIRSLVLLTFSAVVVAVALARLAGVLRSRWPRLSRGGSIGLALVVVLVVLFAFVAVIVPPLSKQFSELVLLAPQAIDQLTQQLRTLAEQPLGQWLNGLLPDMKTLISQVQPAVQGAAQGSLRVFASTLGGLLNVLVVTILALMMLADPQPYRRAFVALFPAFYRRRVDQILDRCQIALDAWLLGILLNMTIIAVFSWLGLMLLGVKLALAHGALAGLLTFIPNVGPALSIIPPILVALLDAPWKAVGVLVLYFLVQQLETNLLTPYVMSKQVDLLPAVTLLAQVFFATLFGFGGLVLALPLTVVAQVWFQAILVEDILDSWSTPPRFLRSTLGPIDPESASANPANWPDGAEPASRSIAISPDSTTPPDPTATDRPLP